ncbi:hypothetical protein RMS29_020465 [Agrobacterium rosae]|uniref:Uncharacterized protein n=1 Tax=Agrobacterium rosae TaxID=1972867 RepID=A0AAE5RYL3_9HYPH|nr:hypothetical protein [Agrobacterium rosae]KAA3511418.1 hypothetical protein DXM21_13170 [Agrobacterium rosae]KAA3519158.1 hypothetical protein DXM25_14855 [Agrobacterium rosae]MBN7806979.1 hypothetical protein [Agrobacterium rosae]MCM2436200.1 hypothetical protein [Agrobacterium rosae]MDX8332267.1 hypothetical protein [Agrobacterium rosae]
MSRFNFGVLSASACIWIASIVPSYADDGSIKEFLLDQGCALGPSTLSAAINAKIDPALIAKLTAEANADSGTIKTGDWMVLPRDKCEIQPPRVKSAIAVDDPEVSQNTSAVDAYIKDGSPGCYLDGPSLFEAVEISRGWAPDKANQEYLRFLSAGLTSGDLSFFSSDPLRTPPGIMITRGDCANIPQIHDIRRSHELLVKHFDALIRSDAAGEATCDSLGFPSWNFTKVSEGILGEKAPNAWMGFEISFIAMGAGWFEGQSATEKGRPRPPLCHYDGR